MNEPQTIDTLRERYSELNVLKTKAATDLALAEQRLELAKKNALEQFGTDDLEELEKKLSEWQEENERKRSEYQTQLDGIEAELERVRQEHEAQA